MITQDLPTNTAMQTTYAVDNRPGAGYLFGQGIMGGLETTSPGLVISNDAMMEAKLGKPITEAEWKGSEYYRESLKYEPGMTREFSEILAHRKDRDQARAFAAEEGGWGGFIANLAGQFIGSIPDPLNFIPMVGQAAKAKAIAKLGTTAGTALVMSAEAAGGAALLQPFLAGDMAAHQDEYDFKMAAESILIAAGIGGALGAGVGWASRVKTPDKVASTSKAVADVIDGRPVDTAAVMRLEPVAEVAPERVQGLQAEYRTTIDQIAEIERQMFGADDATKATLQETHGALTRHADDLGDQIIDTSKPEMAVAPRENPVFPETQPTTKLNAYEPVAADEVDFSIVDKRYAELEAAGLFDDEVTRDMEAVALEKEEVTKWSKALDLAGTCLMRKG